MDTFFAIHLFTPTGVLAWIVAAFTTIKSLAFLLSIVGALLAFFLPHLGDWYQRRRTPAAQT